MSFEVSVVEMKWLPQLEFISYCQGYFNRENPFILNIPKPLKGNLIVYLSQLYLI